jgi:hypothetical protein
LLLEGVFKVMIVSALTSMAQEAEKASLSPTSMIHVHQDNGERIMKESTWFST